MAACQRRAEFVPRLMWPAVRVLALLVSSMIGAPALAQDGSSALRGGHCIRLLAVADAAAVAAGVCEDNSIDIFDPWTGQNLRRVSLPDQRPEALRISADGTRLVSKDIVQSLIVDIATGAIRPVASMDDFPIPPRPSGDGALLTATFEFNKDLVIIDAASGAVRHRITDALPAYGGDSTSANAFSADHRFLATSVHGQALVRFYDAAAGTPFWDVPPPAGTLSDFETATAEPRVSWEGGATGHRALIAFLHRLLVVDVGERRVLREIVADDSTTAAILPGDRLLVTGKAEAVIYAITDGRRISRRPVEPGYNDRDLLVVAVQGDVVVLGSGCGFDVWDTASDRIRRAPGRAVAGSADGRLLLLADTVSATVIDAHSLNRVLCVGGEDSGCDIDAGMNALTCRSGLADDGQIAAIERLLDLLRKPGAASLLSRYKWALFQRATKDTLAPPLYDYEDQKILDPERLTLDLIAVLEEAGRDHEAVARLVPLLGSTDARVAAQARTRIAALDSAADHRAGPDHGADAVGERMRRALAAGRPVDVLAMSERRTERIDATRYNTDDPWQRVRLLRAEALVALGRWAEAEHITASVLREGGTPDARAQALSLGARIVAQQGRREQAASLLSQAAALTEGTLPADHAEAIAAEVAIARFQAVSLKDPTGALPVIEEVRTRLARQGRSDGDRTGRLDSVGRDAAKLAVDIYWQTGQPSPPPAPDAGTDFRPRPLRHNGPVTGLGFAPDGRTLFSSGDDGQLIAWDVATGRPLHARFGLSVFQLLPDPRGRWLLTSDYKGLTRWTPALDIDVQIDNVQGPVTLSMDGNRLIAPWKGAMYDTDRFARIRIPTISEEAVAVSGPTAGRWAFSDVRGSDPSSELRICQWTEGRPDLDACMSGSADALIFAHPSGELWGENSGSVFRFERGRADEARETTGPRANAIAAGPGDTMILTGEGRTRFDRDIPLSLLDLHTRGTRWTAHIVPSADRRDQDNELMEYGKVAESPRGDLIAAADRAGTIRLIDSANGQVVRTLGGEPPLLAPTERITWMGFYNDGTRILLASASRTQAWSVSNRVRLGDGDAFADPHLLQNLAPGTFVGGDWSYGKDRMALDTASGRALDMRRGEGVRLVDRTGRHGTIFVKQPRAAVFLPGAERAVLLSDEGLVAIDTTEGGSIAWRSSIKPGTTGLVASPSGRWIVGTGTALQVWDAGSGVPVPIDGSGGEIIDEGAFSPDGKVLLIQSGAGVAMVAADSWTGGSKIASTSAVTAAAWSPRGDVFALGDADGGVTVFDARSALPRFHVRAHATGVERLLFSPDGQRLVSAAHDASVAIWDIASQRPVGILGE